MFVTVVLVLVVGVLVGTVLVVGGVSLLLNRPITKLLYTVLCCL